MRNPADITASVGLIVGATFGIAGTFVSSDAVRQIFWGLDGIGVIVGTSLLAIRFVRAAHDIVAAGFLVFALGEALLVSGTPAGLDASVPSFGGGVALWSAGLLLISVPKALAMWIRVAGVIAAVLFTIVAARIFSGEHLVPTSSALPFFAYPVVVVNFLGWTTTLLRRS